MPSRPELCAAAGPDNAASMPAARTNAKYGIRISAAMFETSKLMGNKPRNSG
jgi:hypothetical protein